MLGIFSTLYIFKESSFSKLGLYPWLGALVFGNSKVMLLFKERGKSCVLDSKALISKGLECVGTSIFRI